MPLHATFLVRCWFGSQDTTGTAVAYSVESVETGERFRAANLEEVSSWIARKSIDLARTAVRPPGTDLSGEAGR